MNTFSPLHKKYLLKLKKKKAFVIAFRILILAVLIGLWELMASLKLIDAFLFSSPSRIIKTLGFLIETNQLFPNAWISTRETIIGFTISTLLGTGIAILLWWCPTVNKILEPYIVVLNSLPKVALGPIIIIWMGLGQTSIISMAVLISIVITILNMLTAFNSTSADKILLMRTMNASKMQIFTKLIMPSNLYNFVSTLKINVGLAWVGTIMGEYLVSNAGLGYLIIYGGQVFKLDLVMTCIIILCLLASVMYFLVALLERKMSRYKTNSIK